MIALVTGAAGCIGYALVTALCASPEYTEVRALVRPETVTTCDLPSGVRVVPGRLEDDPDALQALVQNVGVVFHCAAKVHDAHGTREDFWRVNVNGTQNLLQACGTVSPPPRFVFFSTVAVYGDDTPPGGLPEDAPANPQTPYAASKEEAEKRVKAWGEQHNVGVVNLRVATVYGPRDRGNLGRMFHAVARKRFVRIGSGENRKTCVAVQNVAYAALFAARWDEGDCRLANGMPLVVADPDGPYTLREILTTMETALDILRRERGDNAKRKEFPPFAAHIKVPVQIAVLLARLAGPFSPVSVDQIRKLAADNVYPSQHLRQIPGYFPPVRLSEGMRQVAENYYDGREREARV